MKKRGIEKDMEDNIIKGKLIKNNILIGEFAKELDNGMGPKKFFQWLREQGYLSPNKDITYNLLEKAKIKNIIYILNATQLGTNDDKFFLIDLEELKNKKDIKILFILNKIDSIDEDRENKEEIIKNVEKYLEENNFKNYLIFPLSAYLAKLIRKVLNNIALTRVEKRDLKKYYNTSTINESEKDEYINFKEFSLSRNKLEGMLEESGILDIEDAIQNINEFYPTFSLRIV